MYLYDVVLYLTRFFSVLNKLGRVTQLQNLPKSGLLR